MNNVRNTLRQRAIKAAKKLENTEIIDGIELIYFRIESETYAIEAGVVSEVHKYKEPTPVPFTPAYIQGVFHMRGNFVSLVNLKIFLGIPEQNEKVATLCILFLSDENMEFGVAVDEVIEQKRVSKKEIQTLTAGFDLPRADLILGVMENGVIVLDGKKLLADPTMIVHK
mgnify:CR=1 FL=1